MGDVHSLLRSGNLAPVLAVGIFLIKCVSQYLSHGSYQMRVSGEYLAGSITRPLHQHAVLGQVGQAQMQSVTALLRAFQVTGAAQFEVFLGNLESIGGVGHHLHPASHVGSCCVAGDKYAP